jgi:hypothetical protein
MLAVGLYSLVKELFTPYRKAVCSCDDKEPVRMKQVKQWVFVLEACSSPHTLSALHDEGPLPVVRAAASERF